MTVYVCRATRGECELADTCAIHQDRQAVAGEVHVCFFVSDQRGEACPHYMAHEPEGEAP